MRTRVTKLVSAATLPTCRPAASIIVVSTAALLAACSAGSNGGYLFGDGGTPGNPQGNDGGVSTPAQGDDASATMRDASVTARDGSAPIFVADATPPVRDASRRDANVTPGFCSPANVSNFSPGAYKGIVRARQGLCSNSQIADYYASCLDDNAPAGACNTKWGTSATANQACGACLATQETASRYGALVVRKGLITVNLPGCIEAKGDATCAATIQTESLCDNAACFANCPVTDQASLDDYRQCTSDANQNGCSAFSGPADTCRARFADAGPGTAADCFSGQSFEDLFTTAAAAICGN